MGIQAPVEVKFRLIQEAISQDNNVLSVSNLCTFLFSLFAAICTSICDLLCAKTQSFPSKFKKNLFGDDCAIIFGSMLFKTTDLISASNTYKMYIKSLFRQ